MRGQRSNRQPTVNVSVTNISYSTRSCGAVGARHSHYRWRGQGIGRPNNRPPKLQRFYASFGTADRSVAEGMRDGEFISESAKVARHNAIGVVSGVADSFKEIGRGLSEMFGALFL